MSWIYFKSKSGHLFRVGKQTPDDEIERFKKKGARIVNPDGTPRRKSSAKHESKD